MRVRSLVFFASFLLFEFLDPAALSAERRVPEIPPPDETIRVVIDTDAACEIDDQYAIALALLSPERFQIEGFVGAHFGEAGGPEGISRSVEEIERVLELAGLSKKYPVKRGADPLQYSQVPTASEGVDFIIEKAMAQPVERPLWIVSLGACTDVVSAYLKEPRVAKHIVVFWHGRTRWPDRCWNFNAYNDVRATRILFASKLPLILFDTGTYLRAPLEETEQRIAPCGELGSYLHRIRFRSKHFQSPQKGFFDLGDIATLVDPTLAYWEVTDAPGVDWDLSYQWDRPNGKILRVYQVDRDRTFGLLYRKLSGHAVK